MSMGCVTNGDQVVHTAFVQLGLNERRSGKGVSQMQIGLYQSQDAPYRSGVSNLSEAIVQR